MFLQWALQQHPKEDDEDSTNHRRMRESSVAQSHFGGLRRISSFNFILFLKKRLSWKNELS